VDFERQESTISFQADRLIAVVCTGPWSDRSDVPYMNLIVVELQRSFSAKGGPFFTFSLEFFASIMGTILTYFIVLVQIKD